MNRKDVGLRNETVSDYRTVEELTREAFWNHHVPGCDEHYLLHIMRKADSFIHELDIVAEVNGKIVGCDTVNSPDVAYYPNSDKVGIIVNGKS